MRALRILLLAFGAAACGDSTGGAPPAAPLSSLDGVAVSGELPAEDLRAAAGAALAHEGVTGPVMSIRVRDRDHVEVMTGEVRGMLDASGQTVELERRGAAWVVTGVKDWIS